MSAASRECALLVIAHLLSTVQHADQIVLLGNAIAVAAGRHERLCDDSELYRGLVAGQRMSA